MPPPPPPHIRAASQVLGKFAAFLGSVKHSRACAEVCIRWLTAVASDHDHVMAWFYEHLGVFREICQLHGWVLKTK